MTDDTAWNLNSHRNGRSISTVEDAPHPTDNAAIMGMYSTYPRRQTLAPVGQSTAVHASSVCPLTVGCRLS
jgi:hypothetical protein